MQKNYSGILLRITDFIFAIGSLLAIFWFASVLFDKSLLSKALIDRTSYIGGATALITAWVAFYLVTVRPLLKRPQLKFADPSKKEAIQKSIPDENDIKAGAKNSWFIRLRITNNGLMTAKRCTGRLLRVVQKDGRPVKKFDPMHLYWARQSKSAEFISVDIQGNGDSFFLDIAQVKEQYNVLTLRVVIPEGHRLILDQDFPNHKNADLPPGIYYVQVAIYGEDGDIKPTWFMIEWDSDYSKDPPCTISRRDPPSYEE